MEKKEEVYYELNRKYVTFYNSDLDLISSYREEGKSLEEIIINNKISVILGDKGSGKTTEIRHFYDNNKNNSIYISLKDIYSSETNFQQKIILLKEKNLDNIFLLFDSIDECRIQSTTNMDAFDITLDKIREILIRNSDVIQKTKIVFTSRRSDWLDNYDRKLIQEKLNINSTSNNQTKIIQNKFDVSVFQLMDLDESRQNIIAQAFNIDVSDFREDIFAQEYSKTPLDCIEFIRFKIRNKNKEYAIEDFLKYKLQRQYRELNEERLDNQLSMTKIEFLSKRLAAATLFRQNISIIKKETYKNIHRENKDISAFDLFPEEDLSTLNHFLNSTLFISNGENTVKFWDELSRDNIAYFWLKDRIANGKYKMIKDLIFNKYENIISPKNNFILPIVFLINSEPEFRKKLIEFNPEILIEYSYCCESLTDFDKRKIIDNLLKDYPYRIQHIFNDTKKSFKIFARNLDVEYLINHLEEIKKSDFWKEIFLVKILLYCDIDSIDNKLKDKMNFILFSYMLNRQNESFNRVAIEILLKQKSIEIIKKIKEYIINNISKISGYIIGMYVDYLYPEFISFTEAINLLNKHIAENKKKHIDILFHLKITLKNLIQKTKINIEDLKLMLDTNTFNFDNSNSLCIYLYLLNAYIDYGGDENNIVEYLLRLQEYNVNNYNELVDDHAYKNKEELEKLKLKITSSINISFIEKIMKKYISLDEKDNFWAWLEYDYFLKKDETLIKFLLDKAKDKSFPKDKIYYLLNYCFRNIKEISPENYKNIVKPYLNTKQELEIWENFISPQIPEWQKKQNKKKNEYEIEREKARVFLLEHIEEIRNAKNFNILINLSLENGMRESSDISFIEKKYGKDISEAYKQGIQKYWQICNVDFNQYVNEIIGTNQILSQTITALTGLHLFFEENKNITLNEEKARRVIYWGIQELNSIPKWAVKTINSYPEIAKNIIIPIIEKIVKENKESFILDKISRIDSEVLSIFYEDLWNILNSISQPNISKYIIKIIVNMSLSEKQKESIIKYITENIDKYDIEDKNVVMLFVFLFDIDLKSFVQKIFEIDKKYCKKREKMKILFEQIFGKVYYKNEDNNKRKDISDVVDLIPLLFKYINPKDDINHENGIVFSPNERDDSQEFRRFVLDYINIKNFTISDRKYLLNLLVDMEDGYAKDHINYIADELLMKNDYDYFSEKDVINIENEDYLPPKNSDDLFKIVCEKLDEIKTDVETSDYSLKELYQDLATTDESKKITKEKFFQKYILMELRRLSRNLYSSVREPEVANNKKPDLQIWDKNWCVNIECKIADNWNGEQLLSAIEEQLIKRYLKYPKYQHGILLLAKIKRQDWTLDNKSYIFVDLVDKLQQYANKIKNNHSSIKGLQVIGIDYS